MFLKFIPCLCEFFKPTDSFWSKLKSEAARKVFRNSPVCNYMHTDFCIRISILIKIIKKETQHMFIGTSLLCSSLNPSFLFNIHKNSIIGFNFKFEADYMKFWLKLSACILFYFQFGRFLFSDLTFNRVWPTLHRESDGARDSLIFLYALVTYYFLSWYKLTFSIFPYIKCIYLYFISGSIWYTVC